MAVLHVCTDKFTAGSDVASAAVAFPIVMRNDRWWVKVNSEYEVRVIFCPFCGVKLET